MRSVLAAFGRATEEPPPGVILGFFCFEVEDYRRFFYRVRNFRLLMLAGDARPEAYLKQ